MKKFSGCHRQWWYAKRQNLVEGDTGATRLGTILHALVEAHVLGLSGPKREAHIKASTKPLFASERHIPPSTNEILQAEGLFAHGLKNGIIPPPLIEGASVEEQFKFPYPGIGDEGINGRVDYKSRTERLIVDYKTTSNPRYAETEESLSTNSQAICYAKALLDELGGDDPIAVEFRYFRTKKFQESWAVRILLTPDEIREKWNKLIIGLVDQMLVYYNQDEPDAVPCDDSNCKAFGRTCPAFEVCSKNNRKAVTARSLRSTKPSVEVPIPMANATIESLISSKAINPITQSFLKTSALGKIAVKVALAENPTDDASAGKALDVILPNFVTADGKFGQVGKDFNAEKVALSQALKAELAKQAAAASAVNLFASGLKTVAQVALTDDQQAIAEELLGLGYPEDVANQLVVHDFEQASLILESGTLYTPDSDLGEEEDAPAEVVSPTPTKGKAAATKTAVATPPTVKPEPPKPAKASAAPDFGHDALNARWATMDENLQAAFLKGISDCNPDYAALGELSDSFAASGECPRATMEASLRTIFERERWKSGTFADSVLALLGGESFTPPNGKQVTKYVVTDGGGEIVAPLVKPAEPTKPTVSRTAPPVTHVEAPVVEAPAPKPAPKAVEAPKVVEAPVVVAPKPTPKVVEAPVSSGDPAEDFADFPLHGAILCLGVLPPASTESVELSKVIFEIDKTALTETGKSPLSQQYNDGLKKVIGPKLVEMAESGAFAGQHVVVDVRHDTWRILADFVLGAWLHHGALVYRAIGA